MTGVYTITHDATGIRINQPSGTVLTFANQAYLAERLVWAIAEAEQLRKWVESIRKAASGPLGSDAPPAVVAYQQQVLKAVNEEIPF